MCGTKIITLLMKCWCPRRRTTATIGDGWAIAPPPPLGQWNVAQSANTDEEDSMVMRLCDRLSANDPEETVVDMRDLRWRHCRNILTALQTNTHLVQLMVYTEPLYNYGGIDELLTVISDHRNLRILTLEDHSHDYDPYTRLLRAVSANAGIEELVLHGVTPQVAALAEILGPSSQSKIKSLRVTARHEADRMASVFQQNTTLEKLVLHDISHPYELLSHLQQHVALRELTLFSSSDYESVTDSTVNGLVAMFRGSVQLCSLSFEGYSFTATHSQNLTAALSMSATLTSLSLRRCEFTEDATSFFLRYLQMQGTSYAVRRLAVEDLFDTFGTVFSGHETGDAWERTLRQSGSLHSFDIGNSRQWRRYVHPTYSIDRYYEMILGYCNRNRYLPEEVARQPSLEGNDSETILYSIFPLLFAAAQQSPRISSTRILTGLLGLGRWIGPEDNEEEY